MGLINITGNCPIPHFRLVGDPEMAFKQLGEQDAATYRPILNELKNLLNLDFIPIDFLIGKGLRHLANKVSKNLLYPEYFSSYLSALAINEKELLSAYMVPEVITALKKFMPKIPARFMACSSLLAYDPHDNLTVHGRVLDFPVIKDYIAAERAVIYNFPHHPQIWSLGLAGLPLASLTAFNSEGVSLALHMKYGDFFNLQDGHLIFEIAFKILMESKNSDDVIKILKCHRSISTWGLYLTFKGGTALSVDLFGGDFRYQIKDLRESDDRFEYGNNAPIEPSFSKLGISSGLDHYCSMRRKSLVEKMKSTSHLPSMPTSSLEILKILGRPLVEKKEDAKDWKQDTTTLTSVHTLSMVAEKGEISLIPGDVPKILDQQLLKIKDVFTADQNNPISFEYLETSLPPLDPNFKEGFLAFAHAENHYEQKNLPLAYHEIQMAIELLEGYPEKIIAEFYFMMMKMVNFDKELDLLNLLKDFRKIQHQLPYYIKDHAILSIARLERIVHGKTTILENEIETEDLKKIYQFEMNLPPFLLKKMRGFISLQMGTMDVIYTYPF